MNKIVLILLSTTILLSVGCAQPIHQDLTIHLKNLDQLCLFTENQNTFLDETNSFLVFVSEIQAQSDYKNVYSKDYKNRKFPIKEQDCITIPLSVIKFNVPYSINVESNKNFSTRVCVNQSENKVVLKILDSGEFSCK